MVSKLYVGNLPYSFTSQELRQLFEPFGAVRSADVVLDRMSGRSRGFGFVEMETAEGVQAAIAGLHETEIGGRNLTVNEARERAPGGPGGGGPRGFGGPRPAGPPSDRRPSSSGPPRTGGGGFHGGGGFRSPGSGRGGRDWDRPRERNDRWEDGAERGRRGGRDRDRGGDDEV
ncbi:MAG: RNA-binding protein [Planctomycetes bacterium]|nr:RNA-binding protein [Planctomycetota bacterium]